MYINQHFSLNVGVKITYMTGEDAPLTEDYQFLCVQKGSIQFWTKEQPDKILLQQEDLILIPPNQQFFCSPYTPSTVLGIRIDAPYLTGIIPAGHVISCNSAEGPKRDYKQLQQILSRICSTYYTQDCQLLLASLMLELTDCLKKNFMRPLNTETLSDLELRNQERITTITQYLQEYYHQSISLELLAEKMYLTPQYLSKFIKKHLGFTFSHYLTSIRLEHAHTELLNTENSITNIALNNGFPNISAFNKVFREVYGQSPSTCRTQGKQRKLLAAERFKGQVEFPDYEPGPSLMEINTDTGSVQVCQKPWADTINIGPLPDALKVSFHNCFLEYQRCIPIKYVRFQGIFDEEILYQDPESKEFNFTSLNDVLDFFKDAGVVPFVELGPKPPRTHIVHDSPWQESHFSSSRMDAACCPTALKALLKHCINRYGINYMSQWRFELWLPHGPKLKYPDSFDKYFTQYQTFQSIVKELLPSCAFGGPGFNMCGNAQIFRTFLKEADKNHLSFDFISLYGYCYESQNYKTADSEDSQGIISVNPNHLSDNFLKYKELLSLTRFGTLPLYLTELASSLALENYIEDSLFQAAFLCRTMVQLLPFCASAAYLSFWDNSPDMAATFGVYYPSSSLVGENGIPKPALHGYSFLAGLGRNLISHGDNYIMTCNSSNRYQLIFYHYVHYNDSFCFNPWDRIPLEHTYEVFCQEESLSVRFTCGGFPPGRYKIKKLSLNRGYGSALDKYLRILETGDTTSGELLGMILNLSEEEARYYKQTSIPRQDIYYITCGDTLELRLQLTPHEVVFYELSRIF